MKKILLRGYFGHGNLGDDLLLYEALEKCPPDYELYILGDEESLNPFKQYRDFTVISKTREILKNYFSMTMFFGGGIFPDRTYNYRGYFSMIVPFLTSKVVVMNGIGIVPKIGKKSKFWFRKLLNSVDYISVRDDISLEYVKNLKIKHDCSNCGDLFWGSSSLKKPLNITNLSGKILLICLAEPFSRIELENENINNRYKKFVKVMQDTIVYLLDKEYKQVFLPFFKNSDSILIENILTDSRIKNMTIMNEGLNFELSQIEYLFKTASFGLCMRFHSKVLSIKNGLPFVGICYDYKSVSMLKESNINEVGLKYGIRKNQFFGEEIDITFKQLREKIDYVISNNQYIKANMFAFSSSKKKSVLDNHSRIFNLLR